jgi:hypothetical protein
MQGTMTVFTVHAPVDRASEKGVSEKTEKFVFIRDGFHFWAFIFGPFWFLWNRLWLAFGLYVLAALALGATLSLLNAGADTRFMVWLLVAFLVGLEAASLKRWSYSRRKWRQVDFVVADKADSAERIFFDRWASADRRTPPRRDPATPVTAAHVYGPASGEVIGSFPQPGGMR